MEALHASLHGLSGPDDIDALLSATDELARLDDGGTLTVLALDARLARVQALVLRGNMPAAYRELEAYGTRAEQLGLTEAGWLHQRMLAQREYQEGRLSEAMEGYERLRQRGLRVRLNYANMFYAILVGGVLAMRQDMAPILTEIRKRQDPTRPNTPSGQASLLAMEAEAGVGQRTRGEYERIASEGFADIPKDLAWLQTLCNLATVARVHEDRPRMERLRTLLTPYARFNTPTYLLLCQGSVAHFLGRLAATLGDEEEAAQMLELAVDHNLEMGFTPFAARSRVALAELLARSAPERARRIAREALSTAEAIGMVPLAARARAVL
jgi:hypothetical protein